MEWAMDAASPEYPPWRCLPHSYWKKRVPASTHLAKATNWSSPNCATQHLQCKAPGAHVSWSQNPPGNGHFPAPEEVKSSGTRRRLIHSSPPFTVDTSVPSTQTYLSPTGRWIQYSKARTTATTANDIARKVHTHKHRKREEHRSSKLKLRKLRNIILLCR